MTGTKRRAALGLWAAVLVVLSILCDGCTAAQAAAARPAVCQGVRTACAVAESHLCEER